jgi:hypothetical protein
MGRRSFDPRPTGVASHPGPTAGLDARPDLEVPRNMSRGSGAAANALPAVLGRPPLLRLRAPLPGAGHRARWLPSPVRPKESLAVRGRGKRTTPRLPSDLWRSNCFSSACSRASSLSSSASTLPAAGAAGARCCARPADDARRFARSRGTNPESVRPACDDFGRDIARSSWFSRVSSRSMAASSPSMALKSTPESWPSS